MVGADRGGYPLCGAYFPEVCAGCRLQAAGSPFPVLSGDPNCHDSPLDCPSVRVGTWLRSAGGGAGSKRRFCQLPPFVGLCPLGLTDALGGVAGGEPCKQPLARGPRGSWVSSSSFLRRASRPSPKRSCRRGPARRSRCSPTSPT